MELVQARIVTDDVRALAACYAKLIGRPVVLNDYYVEVPAGAATVGFSHRRFAECSAALSGCAGRPPERSAQVMLDFLVPDVDAEFPRLDRVGVDWVMHPKTQPWGSRAMVLRDPVGVLVNVFSRSGQTRG